MKKKPNMLTDTPNSPIQQYVMIVSTQLTQ